MSPKTTRRGFDQNDQKYFSSDALLRLITAQEEIQWLIDRGYKLGTVVDYVGSHYQFSSRQRAALQRASASTSQRKLRESRRLPFEAAKESGLNIDGFNLIITLEVALSGGLIILGKDGVYRDLAGLRGTYSMIDHTDRALELIGKCFKELSVPEATFYLDRPVSNSGRLKAKILEYADQWNIPVQVELVPNADVVVSELENVVTGDSVILDHCKSWFNLSAKIIGDYIKDARTVSFI